MLKVCNISRGTIFETLWGQFLSDDSVIFDAVQDRLFLFHVEVV